MTAAALTRCTAPVMFGARPIGRGQRALVIAEAGVNHDGVVADALRLVDVAADAGADVVKFQMFSADELVTAAAAAAAYQRRAGATSQRDMLVRLELSDTEFERVAAHCAARGVDFLATPFGPADVERLVALQPPAIKIASTDLTNTLLLDAALATALPLIVSTGAASAAEIERAVGYLKAGGAASRLVLLHCISGYPAPLAVANLRAIQSLSTTYDVPAGFSDHTESTLTGGWAVAAGACVVEKHFTLDRTRPGPDHAFSLEPPQLHAYVRTLREAETALGTGVLGMTPVEADVRQAARRSVVARVAIPPGTRLTPHMLTVKRPAGGIEPHELPALIGRTTRAAIPADTPLSWDQLA